MVLFKFSKGDIQILLKLYFKPSELLLNRDCIFNISREVNVISFTTNFVLLANFKTMVLVLKGNSTHFFLIQFPFFSLCKPTTPVDVSQFLSQIHNISFKIEKSRQGGGMYKAI